MARPLAAKNKNIWMRAVASELQQSYSKIFNSADLCEAVGDPARHQSMPIVATPYSAGIPLNIFQQIDSAFKALDGKNVTQARFLALLEKLEFVVRIMSVEQENAYQRAQLKAPLGEDEKKPQSVQKKAPSKLQEWGYRLGNALHIPGFKKPLPREESIKQEKKVAQFHTVNAVAHKALSLTSLFDARVDGKTEKYLHHEMSFKQFDRLRELLVCGYAAVGAKPATVEVQEIMEAFHEYFTDKSLGMNAVMGKNIGMSVVGGKNAKMQAIAPRYNYG
jgi:hypothetical protein